MITSYGMPIQGRTPLDAIVSAFEAELNHMLEDYKTKLIRAVNILEPYESWQIDGVNWDDQGRYTFTLRHYDANGRGTSSPNWDYFMIQTLVKALQEEAIPENQ
jgi:hypothetical protein